MDVPVTSFFSLSEALSTWREWGLSLTQTPELVGAVPGGRTNRSYLLHASDLNYDLLLRLNNPQGQKLGINREHEAEILQAVAGAGLTCGACYWDPQQRFTIFRHIEARTWSARDFTEPRQRHQLLESLGQAHQLQPGVPRRRYYDYLNHYWQQLEQAGQVDARLRSEWQAFASDLQAFDRADWPVGLTHHDLIPENILESQDKIYLIDWEYAALGHPDIDFWCLDQSLVQEPFIHELMHWTNGLWERLVQNLNS